MSGRFLNEDSTKFTAGINFYRYVHNNPVLYADPSGLTTYKNFPEDKKVEMLFAVQAVKDKLNSTCPSCAGPDAKNILDALDGATFIYNKKEKACGNSSGHNWYVHRIEIGPGAFGPECCKLPSVILHETFHLLHLQPYEDDAYALEFKCFGCTDPRKK